MARRPIETAPKDGTEILAFWGETPCVAFWKEGKWELIKPWRGGVPSGEPDAWTDIPDLRDME